MTTEAQTVEINDVQHGIGDFHITPVIQEESSDVIFNDIIDRNILAKWPKLKRQIPAIFVHKVVDFAQHAHKLLTLNINFYQPYLGTNYTKIFCQSFNDYKAMLQYLDKYQLPYHTFGHPDKRKMRVIIRDLAIDTDLDKLKLALNAASIPIIRAHKMHMKDFAKNRSTIVLVVVPHNDQGMKLLRVKKIFGCDVTVEPPILKVKQCHRCQRWGHTQRYCHGEIKCVKCAGDHVANKCQRDKNIEPPTCANCGGNHTASYRECFFCPESTEYKQNLRNKIKDITPQEQTLRQLVTMENYERSLYKKVSNIPRHNEAIPF